MLRPTKHMNPDRSVLALSALLLKRLRKRRVDGYSDLQAFAMKKARDVDTLFPGALSLLFVLGLIEYRTKTDAFEYVGP